MTRSKDNPILSSHGNAPSGGLSAMVRQHLEAYFAAHNETLPPDGLYERVMREVEMPLITLALKAVRGNQVQAARMLGINRNTLRKKMLALGLPSARK